VQIAPSPQWATRRAAAARRRAPRHQTTRAAPPPHTFPQVRCACPTLPPLVARSWLPSDARRGHAARCVGGGVGGGTPRRAVAGQ